MKIGENKDEKRRLQEEGLKKKIGENKAAKNIGENKVEKMKIWGNKTETNQEFRWNMKMEKIRLENEDRRK